MTYITVSQVEVTLLKTQLITAKTTVNSLVETAQAFGAKVANAFAFTPALMVA